MLRFTLILLIALLYSAELQPAGYPPADLELATGKFLVATSRLMDPRFMQTVVLIVDYDKEGAMGLIINYPSGIELSKAFPDLNALKRVKEEVFYGGPVDRTSAFLLLRSMSQPEESIRLFDHVYLSKSKELLEEKALAVTQTEKFRVFAGYSGWGKGQLEAEIQSGHWLVWHADTETIFDKPAKEIWPEMIRRTSVLQAKNLPQRRQDAK